MNPDPHIKKKKKHQTKSRMINCLIVNWSSSSSPHPKEKENQNYSTNFKILLYSSKIKINVLPII